MKIKIEKVNDRVMQAIIPTGTTWRPEEAGQDGIWETGPLGKACAAIAEAIDTAKEMICVCSFIMDNNMVVQRLEAAADRGVKVYVLGSASAKLQDEIEEVEDSHRRQYEELLKEKFRNRFLFRSAEYFHAKFVLVDPRTTPKGFLCTCNLTTKALHENPELIIRLDEPQITALFRVFVYHFWEQATHEHGMKSEFEAIKPLGHFAQPSIAPVLACSPEASISNIKSVLGRAIQAVKNSIVISTFSIERDFELVKMLRTKLKDGVKLTVFARALPAQVELLFDLLQEGAELYIHPLLHAKFLLVDQTTGFVFTANFKRQGMENGFEVGVQLNESQCIRLAAIAQEWRDTFPKRGVSNVKLWEYLGKLERLEGKLLVEKLVTPKGIHPIEDAKVNTVGDIRKKWEDANKKGPKELQNGVSIEQNLVLKELDQPIHGTRDISSCVRVAKIGKGEGGKKGKEPNSQDAIIVSSNCEVNELLQLDSKYDRFLIYREGVD